MNKFSKLSVGAAAAAFMTVSVAAPAQAQYYDRSYRHHDRGGISAGDIITGVAVLGGIAAIASALGRDGNRYGSRYRDDYRNAVNSCAYEAERAGRGRVNITDVDRRSNYSYRVRGTIDASYGYDNRGYDNRGYDNRGYDDRYGRYDDGYGRYDNRYGNYDNRYYGQTRRIAFTCWAQGDGRVSDFRFNDNNRW
jgi:hypothetical protein